MTIARNFRLAVLLALREQRERAEERTLAQTNAALSDVRQVLRRIADELTRQAEGRLGQADTVRLGADLLSSDARWKELRNAEAEMHAKLQVLEAKRLAQMQDYLRVRSDRETLTQLGDQHRREWENHEKLREQKVIGDLFVARRKRR